jgi:hypothetical protein
MLPVILTDLIQEFIHLSASLKEREKESFSPVIIILKMDTCSSLLFFQWLLTWIINACILTPHCILYIIHANIRYIYTWFWCNSHIIKCCLPTREVTATGSVLYLMRSWSPSSTSWIPSPQWAQASSHGDGGTCGLSCIPSISVRFRCPITTAGYV